MDAWSRSTYTILSNPHIVDSTFEIGAIMAKGNNAQKNDKAKKKTKKDAKKPAEKKSAKTASK